MLLYVSNTWQHSNLPTQLPNSFSHTTTSTSSQSSQFLLWILPKNKLPFVVSTKAPQYSHTSRPVSVRKDDIPENVVFSFETFTPPGAIANNDNKDDDGILNSNFLWLIECLSWARDTLSLAFHLAKDVNCFEQAKVLRNVMNLHFKWI